MTGGGNVLSLGKMIQLEKRKKLEPVSHPSVSLIKAELNYKKTLSQMCYVTDVSCPLQNQAGSKPCHVKGFLLKHSYYRIPFLLANKHSTDIVFSMKTYCSQ